MSKKGISRELILEKTVELVEQKGRADFSLREVAEALGIRTPSLYNHVKSLGDLQGMVACYAAEQFKRVQCAAMEGKERDEAVLGLAFAYRSYAKEHPGLYRVTISLPHMENGMPSQAASTISEPVFQVLGQYGLSRERSVHWLRILRSIIHGFVFQEEAGFFQHPYVSVEESYRLAIRGFLDGLHVEIGGDHSGEQ